MADDVIKIKRSTLHIAVVVALVFGLGYVAGISTLPTTAQPQRIAVPQVQTDPLNINAGGTNGIDLAGTSVSLGNDNAPVTVVEFSDFQCPFCGRMHEALDGNIDRYIDDGTVKFVYRHFPLRSIHPNAQIAGEASECARDHGMFWEYHDLLFEKQHEWSSSTVADVLLVNYGVDLGIDINDCVMNGEKTHIVDADYNAALSLGVQSTPTIFVNGEQVVGAVPWQTIESTIQSKI